MFICLFRIFIMLFSSKKLPLLYSVRVFLSTFIFSMSIFHIFIIVLLFVLLLILKLTSPFGNTIKVLILVCSILCMSYNTCLLPKTSSFPVIWTTLFHHFSYKLFSLFLYFLRVFQSILLYFCSLIHFSKFLIFQFSLFFFP